MNEVIHLVEEKSSNKATSMISSSYKRNQPQEERISTTVDFSRYGMTPSGEWTPSGNGSVTSSRIGIGFETLDRFMFDPEATYPYLARLGVHWVRVQTGWCRCEKEKGVYDFRWLDQVVDRLRAMGMEILFSVTYGNPLYMSDATHPSAVGHVPIYYDDEVKAAWLAYVDRLSAHFSHRVRFWEIWNEPNIAQFWHPGSPNGADYAELVKVTVPPIKRNAPNAFIVGISTCGISPVFLEEALKAGVGEWIDACSFHPYQAVPEDNLQTMHDATVYLLKKYAPGRDIEIWQGENGCPSQQETHEVFPVYNMDELIHAKWVARRVMIDLKVDFARTFYFHIVDLMDMPYRLSDGAPGKPLMMGLLHGKKYTPKQAYQVFRRICSLFDDQSKRIDLFACFYHTDSEQPSQCGILGSPACVSFERNGFPILAYWLTEDPQQAIPDLEIDLGFWTGDLSLKSPVILDPLTGNYYPAENKRCPFKGGNKFRLPLADYPLILTDAKALKG